MPTREQLLQMGAKSINQTSKEPTKKIFTREELLSMGAVPTQVNTSTNIGSINREGIVGGLAKGAGKSLLGSLKGALDLGEKTIGSVLKGVLPEKAEQFLNVQNAPTFSGKQSTLAERTQAEIEQKYNLKPGSLTEATTPYQKVGKFVTDAAQFVLPGTAAAKVGRGLGAARAAKGAGRLSQFGARIAPQIASDVAVGATQAGSPVEGVKTGVTSLGVMGAGSLIKKASKPITKPIIDFIENTLPKSLAKTAIGQSKKEILAGKDISEFVLSKKSIGTANQLIRRSTQAVTDLDSQILSRLKSVPVIQGKITNKNVIQTVVKEMNEAGAELTEDEVKKIITKLAPQSKRLFNKPSMGVFTANNLRRSIDKTLGDRAFLGSQLPFNKEVLKKFNSTLREQVKTKAPEGTRELFEDLSKEITLRDALLNRYGGRNFSVVQLRDLLGALAGLGTGGVGAAGFAVAANRAAQSPFTLLGTAKTLRALPPIIREYLKKLSPTERAIILRLLNQSRSE